MCVCLYADVDEDIYIYIYITTQPRRVLYTSQHNSFSGITVGKYVVHTTVLRGFDKKKTLTLNTVRETVVLFLYFF